MPRLLTLSDYWSEHPPTHVLVAAYLGYKAKPKAAGVNTPADVDKLLAAFGASPIT